MKKYTESDVDNLHNVIQQLELSLLEPATRRSVDYLNKHIADEFIEFGSSGKIYNKQDVVESLPFEKEKKFNVMDFSIKVLSQDVVLATYKIIGESITLTSLRSSIWKRVDGEWQMVFHQGTEKT